jgi:hypothetical protein
MKGRTEMATRREIDTVACGCEAHTGERKPEEAEAMYDEPLELLSKHPR